MKFVGCQRAWLERDGGAFSKSKQAIRQNHCVPLPSKQKKSSKCDQCDHAFATTLPLKKHKKKSVE